MGRMDGNFRLRLPKLFLLSYITAAFFFFATSLFDSPKLHPWGIFMISSVYNCLFQFLICNSHCWNFFLCHPSGKVIMFCLFRLSNTLSELCVSSSHTSWY